MVDIPNLLRNKQFRFSLVGYKSKQAYEEGWNTNGYCYDDPILLKHLKSVGNYGFICGSGNVIVIDFDDLEFQNKITPLLPDTFTVLSGTGKQHRYYHIETEVFPGEKTINMKDKSKSLGELRLRLCQVIAPGSTHPNGNVYKVLYDLPIVTLSQEVITNLLGPFLYNVEKKQTGNITENDEMCKKIKEKIKIPMLMELYNYDLSRHPTMCKLGHESRSQSCFSYNEDLWHCFHCEKSGNIFHFIMTHDNCKFSEAKRKLTKLAKLDLAGDEEEPTNKPQLLLPINDKLCGEFAVEIAPYLSASKRLYNRSSEQAVICLTYQPLDNNSKKLLSFKTITNNEFITFSERYIIPGIMVKVTDSKGEDEWVFKKRSIGSQLATTLLSSSQLKNRLPIIDNLYSVPLPILINGELAFPNKGYDERFWSWLDMDSPSIMPDIKLQDAILIINGVYQDFCFEKIQDKTNAIAALLTPFCRGLYIRSTCRTPIFFYKANRERAGKDYCAEVTSVLYYGITNSEPPLSDGKETHDDEFRKKVLSYFKMGKNRIHLSNNKGHLNSAQLEALSTNEHFSDRELGKTSALTFPNNLEISLSANTGITYTPDIANRCIFINLFLEDEDPNLRTFSKPDLHGWVKENRSKILSALFALVRTWFEQKCPTNPTPFSSFPEWARVVGGIMTTCGLGDPCLNNTDTINIGGDTEGRDMKQLYKLLSEKFGDKWFKKQDVMDLLSNDDSFKDLFPHIDWYATGSRKKFGIMWERYVGRVFNNLKMIRLDNDHNERRQYKLQKIVTNQSGVDGVVGYLFTTPSILSDIHLQYATDGNLPHLIPTTPSQYNNIDSSIQIPTPNLMEKLLQCHTWVCDQTKSREVHIKVLQAQLQKKHPQDDWSDDHFYELLEKAKQRGELACVRSKEILIRV